MIYLFSEEAEQEHGGIRQSRLRHKNNMKDFLDIFLVIEIFLENHY